MGIRAAQAAYSACLGGCSEDALGNNLVIDVENQCRNISFAIDEVVAV
jgi:hypothetical protein